MLLPSNRKEADSDAGADALPCTAAWSFRVCGASKLARIPKTRDSSSSTHSSVYSGREPGPPYTQIPPLDNCFKQVQFKQDAEDTM